MRARFTASGTIAIAVAMAGCATEPGHGPASSRSTESTSQYRDGEYSARGWYGGLPSHHDVTLTIENGAVIDVEITTPAEDETSLGYQERFAAALPDAIIGRNLDDLAVDRLAGSSGCSEGFMHALAQIKEDAAA